VGSSDEDDEIIQQEIGPVVHEFNFQTTCPEKHKKNTDFQVPSKDILIGSVGEVPKNHPTSPIY